MSPTRKIKVERSSSTSDPILRPVLAPIRQGVAITKSQSRPGNTSKSIIEKPRGFGKERKRIRRTYSRAFKLQLLSYWMHHKIKCGPTQTRSPTKAEVSYRYKVPPTTIQRWKTPIAQAAIVDSTKTARANWGSTRVCKWPELEVLLYERFRTRRDERKSVRRGWLRRSAQEVFAICYPIKNQSMFLFTNGWFFGFLSRHNITLRFATNKSQKIPEDYLSVILTWLRFNRRNSQVRKGKNDQLQVVGRYSLRSICNMDETPLPFEYLDGQTYADKGSHTVQVKTTRSGWDKRQATLVLAIFADGVMRIKPLILFKGEEILRKIHHINNRAIEMARYDPRVIVQWNPNAYANESVLITWILEQLVPALPEGPRLLALDVAKFHKTDAVLDTLRAHDILASMIPAGCTGLVQPLDVSVNKPVKDILRDLVDNALDLYEQKSGIDLRESTKTSAVGERRVLITTCVAEAWERFCTTRKELIVQTFRNLGLSLPIDGSCDDELKVKGIAVEDLQIGDWQRVLGETDHNWQQETEDWGEKVTIVGGADDNDEPRVLEEEEKEISENYDEDESVDFVDRVGY